MWGNVELGLQRQRTSGEVKGGVVSVGNVELGPANVTSGEVKEGVVSVGNVELGLQRQRTSRGGEGRNRECGQC